MQRPTSVTVFGVFNILFGASGLCGLPISLLATLAMRNVSLGNSLPGLNAMQGLLSGPYGSWTMVVTVLNFIAAIVLLASGIGLLMLKSWARTAAIGWSIYKILAVIAGAFMNYFMTPNLSSLQHQINGLGAGTPTLNTGLLTDLGTVMLLGFTCFGLVYPVLLIIFMTRRHVKAAMAPPTDTGSPPGPELAGDDPE